MITLGVIEWAQVSALAACVGVLIASLGVIVAVVFHSMNLASTRLSNSAKMVHDLNQIFSSEIMRKRRKQFAADLLDPDKRSRIDLRNDAPVLEFFEEIGYMARRKVLDLGMIWNSFCWHIEPYYQAITQAPDLIKAGQTAADTSTLYREFTWLYNEMGKVDVKEEGKENKLTADEVRAFLQYEANLE